MTILAFAFSQAMPQTQRSSVLPCVRSINHVKLVSTDDGGGGIPAPGAFHGKRYLGEGKSVVYFRLTEVDFLGHNGREKTDTAIVIQQGQFYVKS